MEGGVGGQQGGAGRGGAERGGAKQPARQAGRAIRCDKSKVYCVEVLITYAERSVLMKT